MPPFQRMVIMLTQIENTPNGYIVGVYIRDGAGNGQWHRLRNFGPRQGDAIEFRDWDIPKFSDAEINGFIRTFKIEDKYERIVFHKYRKDNGN